MTVETFQELPFRFSAYSLKDMREVRKGYRYFFEKRTYLEKACFAMGKNGVYEIEFLSLTPPKKKRKVG